ncbi:DYDC2 [Symbiodinium pilosum]|uniref:DYDC2 protein n=1 Tax=Symbiodinium pilosum TaxID=2952 RepID=A0A812L448_SYMPI|nr:DYDC2 [Symbiodinium pilosum]
MDAGAAQYLQENVGGILAKALAEMAVVQPKDGVDFLSKWLTQYAEQEEAKEQKEQVERELTQLRTQTRAKRDEKEELRQQKVSESQQLEAKYTSLFEKFGSDETMFQDTMWQELVDVAQATAGASAVYLGILEQGEEGGDPAGPYISYEYASKGSEWMTERTLAEGKGVAWGALTENPPEENFKELCLWKPPSVEPVPEELADGEPPAEKPGTPYYPVSIDCVTDVEKVHYFDMTRLGAFLAIPMVYQSYYQSDAYTDAKTFEEEKKAEAKRREEEAAARAAAIANGEVLEDAEPEAVEEKQLVMRGNDVKMILCLDTLGTNSSFEEGNAVKVLELAKACCQSKSKTEFKQVDSQVLTVIDDERRAQENEQITEVDGTVEQMHAEQIEAEEAEATDELRKEVIQKKFAFLRALEVAKELSGMIASLTSWVYATADVMNVVAALAHFAGYTKADIYPRRKSNLNWQRLKQLLQNPLQLLEKVGKVEVEGPRKGVLPEHLHAYIMQMGSPAEMDGEKAKEIAPAFFLLFNLLQAGCAYRTADLELRKAEFNKQKEEAGEEYEGPALEELDDDFQAS